MKRFQILSLLSLFSISLLADNSGRETFQIDVDVIWLKRENVHTIDLVDANRGFCSCACGGSSITADSLVYDFGREVAPQFTLYIRDRDKHSFELKGTTPFDFEATSTISAADNVNLACGAAYDQNFTANSLPNRTTLINIFNSDYIGADSAEVEYKSSYYTIEGNYWTHVTPQWSNYFSFSYTFGLRYLYLGESLTETFYKNTDTSFFCSTTRSNLYGPQGGFDIHIHPYYWLDWGFRIMAGVLVSNLSLHFVANDLNSTVLLSNTAKHTVGYGYLGEIDLFVQGKFYKKFYWNFAFGGTLIRGFMEAPNNINMTTAGTLINYDTNMLFQYWSCGLGMDF